MTDTSSTPTAAQNGAGRPTDAAPMFYKQIEPLSPTVHKDLKIRPEANFSFATGSNSVPLTLPEFTLAARHFPILLLGEEMVPVAALGIRPEQNVFVDKDGKWDTLIYVPAYIRRHPFILLGGPDEDRLTLGVDVSAASTAGDARPLFKKETGKENEVVTQALDFCNQFHGAYLHTRDFSAALKKSGIVTETTLEIEPKPGQRVNLGTFQRVDEEKLKALPDETILEWRKVGFLHAVYFLLQSMNNWDLVLNKAGMWAPVVSPN